MFNRRRKKLVEVVITVVSVLQLHQLLQAQY